MKPISLKVVRKRKHCWKYFKRCRFIYRPKKKKRRPILAEWAVIGNVRFLVSDKRAIILNEDWINSFIKKEAK